MVSAPITIVRKPTGHRFYSFICSCFRGGDDNNARGDCSNSQPAQDADRFTQDQSGRADDGDELSSSECLSDIEGKSAENQSIKGSRTAENDKPNNGAPGQHAQ